MYVFNINMLHFQLIFNIKLAFKFFYDDTWFIEKIFILNQLFKNKKYQNKHIFSFL